MNLDVMKTFCDLVETGSFSKAAEANYVSQSAVSQQLAKLERDLSTQLISRGGGLVAPTDAGGAFYQGAKAMLRRCEQMMGEVRSVADSVRGVLRIGTIYSVGFYLLDPYVRKFIQRHPEVDLHVEYTGWNRIYAAVIGGEMDAGVVACPERQRSIEIIPLASEELVAVVPPDHPLACRKKIDISQLDGEDFVGFHRNIPTRRMIDKVLKRVLREVENGPDAFFVSIDVSVIDPSEMVAAGRIAPNGHGRSVQIESRALIATLDHKQRWHGAES